MLFRSALIRTCRILIQDCFTWPRYLMLLCEAFLCSELREELQCLGPCNVGLEFVFNFHSHLSQVFAERLLGCFAAGHLAESRGGGSLATCREMSELRSHESWTKCRLAICPCCSWAAIALSLSCTECRLNKSDREASKKDRKEMIQSFQLDC